MIRPEIQSLATPITQLKPHPQNVRQGDVGAISQSLEQHGQYRPIVVQQSTGFILAGNHTYKAAKALKWKDIAATYVDVDDEQALRILLIDNRANDLASYDDSALVEMLKALMDTELKLGGTGFDPSDLDQLLKDLEMETGNPVEGDPDAVPDDAPSKTVPGDVWLLGDHRLMCGNSTTPTDVERLMAGAEPNMVFADPPYGISHSGNGITAPTKSGKIVNGNQFGEILGDGDTDIAKAAFLAHYVEETDTTHIWWGANYYPSVIPDGYGWLVWDKERVGDIFSGAEIAFVNHGIKLNVFRHMWHGIAKASESGEKRIHPTQKPVALVKYCFETYGNPSRIFDPFGGSGSTLIAAHQTGRTAYLMELDPHYCDVICKRFQQATGITPIAEATGNEHSFIE